MVVKTQGGNLLGFLLGALSGKQGVVNFDARNLLISKLFQWSSITQVNLLVNSINPSNPPLTAI